MKPAQINFVKECLPAAVSAGAAFNLNPLVILAQAAFESGWGTSNLAKECRPPMDAATLIGMAGKLP